VCARQKLTVGTTCFSPLCSSHISLTVRLPFLFVLEHVCFPHSCWPISIKDRPLDSVVPSSCKEEHQQHNKKKKASGRHHLLCVAYGNGLTLSLSLSLVSFLFRRNGCSTTSDVVTVDTGRTKGAAMVKDRHVTRDPLIRTYQPTVGHHRRSLHSTERHPTP
jgi:hypothetical protein